MASEDSTLAASDICIIAMFRAVTKQPGTFSVAGGNREDGKKYHSKPNEAPFDQSTANKSDKVFVLPTRVTQENKLRRVEFDKIDNSTRDADSVSCLHGSSIEDSLRNQLSNKSSQKKTKKDEDIKTDDNFEKKNKLKFCTELFESPKEEKRALKAIVGIVAGIIIGGLMFLIYHFSFGYTATQAGIISAVLTVLFCVGLALSSFVRCIIALVFPNFFTGIGRAILLSAILSLILQYPVSNISYNAKETGSSMACVLEQTANQTRILQRQLAVSMRGISEYIENQQRELKKLMNNEITSKITDILKGIQRGVSNVEEQITSMQNECRRNVYAIKRQCEDFCQSVPFLSKECKNTMCSALDISSHVCGPQLNIGLGDISEQARRELERFFNNFKADLNVTGDFDGSVHLRKPVVAIREEIDRDITEKFKTVGMILSWLQKFLSLSLLLIFLQSFRYLRNYLGKDGYDNIYITKQFVEFDKMAENHVLPLKKREIRKFVDTRTFRLNSTELSYSKLGFVQVLMHFILYIIVVAFDYALYYILNLIKRYGDNGLEIESRNSFTISVVGDGLVAEFYRLIVKGYDKAQSLQLTIDVKPCLPNATEPSAIMIPVFLVLYGIVLLVVILQAYGMRLRRHVCACYCPEQEFARLEYLHMKIRNKRVGFLKFIRYKIESVQKGGKVRKMFNVPFLARFRSQRCSSCEQTKTCFNDVTLLRCEGTVGGVQCDAVFCQECKAALQDSCPLCTGDNEIPLAD